MGEPTLWEIVSGRALPTTTRPLGVGMPRRWWRYSVRQAAGALAVAGFAASVAASSIGPAQLRLAAAALALATAVVGVTVLFRAKAVRRIDELRFHARLLHDDLVRAELYSDQLGDTLALITEFRRKSNPAAFDDLVDSALSAACERIGGVLRTRVSCYVVRSTNVHAVRWAVGDTGVYGPGRSCPADRSIEEIASDLGSDYHIVRMALADGRYRLVLVAGVSLSDAERELTARLASLLEIASGQPRARPGERVLHAV
jgi:hypothetical protein